MGPFSVLLFLFGVISCFGAVDKTSSSFSAHGKIGNFNFIIVPEVYRKKFRNSHKNPSETYSEYAFRLGVQFKCCLESEDAYEDLDRFRELIQLEQFNTVLDPNLKSWLLDQKPKSVADAARLADQHVAVHTAGRPGQSHHDWKSHQRHRGGPPYRFQSQHQPSKSQPTTSSASGTRPSKPTSYAPGHPRPPFSAGRGRPVCHYCQKPGHVIAQCYKRMAAQNVKSSEGALVQFLDTLPRASVVQPTLGPVMVPKELEPDPLFARHCFDAELI